MKSQFSIDSLLARREKAHTTACKGLAEAVEKCYPVGAIVEATLGIATVRGEGVRHYGSWSTYRLGCFDMVNLRTGKERTVNPLSELQKVKLIFIPLTK
jgi:hypothetical protein